MRVVVLKPDGIGDFVLATGCVRLLAEICGEHNLIICVRTETASLAASQFPLATVFPLKLRQKRRFLNLFLSYLIRNIGVSVQLLTRQTDWVLSLRHARSYYQTLLFFLCRSKNRAMTNNMLLEKPAPIRALVERLFLQLRSTNIAPYPEENNQHQPLELEAHRRVLSLFLQREVDWSEIQPSLLFGTKASSSSSSSNNSIVLCPLSSTHEKDFPMESWVAALRLVPELQSDWKLFLAGSHDQQEQLKLYEIALKEAGVRGVEIKKTRDILELADLLAGARLVLTVDTAAAHMACALDQHALVLFSARHAGVYAPWKRSEKQTWLQQKTSISGKRKRKKKDWHLGFSPQQIADEIEQLLSVQN